MLLSIVHRPVAASPGAAAAAHLGPAWRTCLREVTFVDHGVQGEPPQTAHALIGAEAYAFLLETICGLQSPMLGETQVLGQFRAFLASLSPSDASWLGAVGQQLMTDARAIRERHLRGLGSRCYGCAVRRHLDGADRVAVVGAGALAAELMPYLSEDREVETWSREDIARAQHRRETTARTVLVIAAPVRAQAIAQVAGCYAGLLRIVDLRSADERDALSTTVPVITLDDLFASLEKSAETSAARIAAARGEIRRMAEAFERRQQLRPFGWDDLCA